MSIKLEVAAGVFWFLEKQCGPREQDAFFQELGKVLSEPIGKSKWFSDPEIHGGYVLRVFQFLSNEAIFADAIAEESIRVVECRKL